ncbi:hypothetical protein ACKFKG_10370 [Phormidesmis sp. 146-35]
MQSSLSDARTRRTDQWLIRQQLEMYQFWWAIVSAMNVTLLIGFYSTNKLPYLSGTFGIANLLLATLVQNELVLHCLYRLAVAVSKRVPFGKYHINASVHHMKGVHAASASWGFVWFLIDVLQHLNDLNRVVLVTTSFPLLILLLSIIVTATPLFRHRFHNSFEKNHRYLGWLSLLVLTLHVILLHFSIINPGQAPTLKAVLVDPIVLMTIFMVISVALPWVNVQRCGCFKAHCPSPDVLMLTVPGRANIEAFTQVSLNLIEWHSFSIARLYFDQQTRELKAELIIRATRNWATSAFDHVHKRNLPEYVWIRRVKPPGFMFSIHAYSWVLVIATGAEIISVLPHIASRGYKLCLLWIGSDLQETYGNQVWSVISRHPYLRMYDTGLYGSPNMSQLTAQTIEEFRPQAVFCASNKTVAESVTSLCLAQGIPAYGATS